jgi:hypothetical protein
VVQVDARGNTFEVGCAVSISSSRPEGIPAYSVPRACYGRYVPANDDDDDGGGRRRRRNAFVPMDDAGCLLLPCGLRGKVQRIYDVNEWDRARPLVVYFDMGYDREDGEINGGYDVPRSFVMHFDASELDVVVP